MLYSILFQLLYFVLLMIDQAVVFDIKICVVDGDDYEMKLYSVVGLCIVAVFCC